RPLVPLLPIRDLARERRLGERAERGDGDSAGEPRRRMAPVERELWVPGLCPCEVNVRKVARELLQEPASRRPATNPGNRLRRAPRRLVLGVRVDAGAWADARLEQQQVGAAASQECKRFGW